MDTLSRDLRAAASESYDLLVVGGGIQGAMLALEASRRGLSTLLLERGDFGGETSWNSLRIIHGGLRYLQTMDLARYRESVAERGWLLRHFPDLIEPLPCLMPLHDPPRGGRLRRPAAFRAAFAADAVLRSDRTLPRGRLLSAGETAELFPAVDREGLRSGVLWHDAVVSEPHRLIVEILRWAVRCGARVLNYVEAAELRVEDGRVEGLRVVDRGSGRTFEVRGRAVVSCAGPWVRRVARRFDRDVPGLFQLLIAFNLLLDREPVSAGAVAVASRETGAPTWFLLPCKGKVLAGTAYAPAGEEVPGEAHVEGFLRDLNAALPGLDARREQVARVLWGRLPAVAEGSTTPATRPVIHDHGRAGGPQGLFSVSGVKLTTARAVAEKVLKALAPGLRPTEVERPAADPPLSLDELIQLAENDWNAARIHLRGLVERQSVVELEDLLLRRTDWGFDPVRAETAVRLCESLGWRGFRPQRPQQWAAGGGAG
ncbi:MAG: FAD-dependent oxidoreductase [Thermoanaerobaculia bacterium]